MANGTVAKLTTTGMMQTDQATTVTLLALCILPPETTPTPPLGGEEPHLPTPLQINDTILSYFICIICVYCNLHSQESTGTKPFVQPT